jgi:hypothetical protein
MPPAKRKPENAEQISADEKIARLLALIVVRDIEQPADKIRTLKAAGFGVSHMAPILGMTENAINVALHRARKKDGTATKRASKNSAGPKRGRK